jgi:hypothetical protein
VALAAACAALVLGAALTPSADADAQKLRAAKLDRAAFEKQAEATLLRHPADGFIADVAADRLLHDGDAGEWLDRALLLGPSDVLAHHLTARALLQQGVRDQAALELRIAVECADPLDRDWLIDEALTMFGADGPRLLAAVAEDLDALSRLTERSLERRMWAPARLAGRAALELAPRNAHILSIVVRAGLELKDATGLAQSAAELAEVDASQARLAAEGLAFAGQQAAAEKALATAMEHSSGDDAVEVAVALAGLARSRHDLDRAAEVLDTALVRAVLPRQKARLHNERARVDDEAGRPSRAQIERAEAERLAGH